MKNIFRIISPKYREKLKIRIRLWTASFHSEKYENKNKENW